MRHFVAYHSEDKMGYTVEESDPFGVYTSKRISDPIGDVIWVVAGVGASPKQYFLSSWFVVSEVTEAEHPDFGFTLQGKQGGDFDEMPRLDQLQWFPGFLKRMANFSIGFTELRDPVVVAALQRVAADAGQPQA